MAENKFLTSFGSLRNCELCLFFYFSRSNFERAIVCFLSIIFVFCEIEVEMRSIQNRPCANNIKKNHVEKLSA